MRKMLSLSINSLWYVSLMAEKWQERKGFFFFDFSNHLFYYRCKSNKSIRQPIVPFASKAKRYSLNSDNKKKSTIRQMKRKKTSFRISCETNRFQWKKRKNLQIFSQSWDWKELRNHTCYNVLTFQLTFNLNCFPLNLSQRKGKI